MLNFIDLFMNLSLFLQIFYKISSIFIKLRPQLWKTSCRVGRANAARAESAIIGAVVAVVCLAAVAIGLLPYNYITTPVRSALNWPRGKPSSGERRAQPPAAAAFAANRSGGLPRSQRLPPRRKSIAARRRVDLAVRQPAAAAVEPREALAAPSEACQGRA